MNVATIPQAATPTAEHDPALLQFSDYVDISPPVLGEVEAFAVPRGPSSLAIYLDTRGNTTWTDATIRVFRRVGGVEYEVAQRTLRAPIPSQWRGHVLTVHGVGAHRVVVPRRPPQLRGRAAGPALVAGVGRDERDRHRPRALLRPVHARGVRAGPALLVSGLAVAGRAPRPRVGRQSVHALVRPAGVGDADHRRARVRATLVGAIDEPSPRHAS